LAEKKQVRSIVSAANAHSIALKPAIPSVEFVRLDKWKRGSTGTGVAMKFSMIDKFADLLSGSVCNAKRNYGGTGDIFIFRFAETLIINSRYIASE
jgi:hypothetical protein